MLVSHLPLNPIQSPFASGKIRHTWPHYSVFHDPKTTTAPMPGHQRHSGEFWWNFILQTTGPPGTSKFSPTVSWEMLLMFWLKRAGTFSG
jgi:hypothetical protein